MKTYTCTTDFGGELGEISEDIDADSPENAAEAFVDANLDFDPSDPQSSVEVFVQHLGGDGHSIAQHIYVAIEISWKAVAAPDY